MSKDFVRYRTKTYEQITSTFGTDRICTKNGGYVDDVYFSSTMKDECNCVLEFIIPIYNDTYIVQLSNGYLWHKSWVNIDKETFNDDDENCIVNSILIPVTDMRVTELQELSDRIRESQRIMGYDTISRGINE